MNRALVTILVATAYALIGRLTLELAVIPGFATPIFPSAGIAASAALLWGWPAVAGVALGSFLMNLSLHDRLDAQTMSLCVLIATGAALQATLTRLLLRRFVALEPDLRRDTQLIRFVIAAGPLTCWINALCAPMALFAFNRLAAHDLVNTMLNWYVGDSIGAVFFAPLLYVWVVALPLATRIRTFTLPLLGLFALAVAGFFVLDASRRTQIEQDLAPRVQELQDVLVRTTRSHALVLRAIAGFFDSSVSVDRGEFRSFTATIMQSVPEIRALSWAPRVTREDRTAFETRVAAELGAPFEIIGSSLTRREEADEYFPVVYVESRTRPARLGFDLASEPGRRAAAEAAAAARAPIATSPVPLVTSDMPTRAFVEVQPIFRGGEKLAGLVTAVVVDDFLARLLPDSAASRDIAVRLADVSGERAELVHQGAAWDEGAAASVRFERAFTTEVFGRMWRITVRPTPAFLARHQGHLALASWWVISLLCVTTILGFTGRHDSVRRLVGERTDELTRANERLQKLAADKSEFLANMSHEIRTPLNGVIGLTQTLLERELPPAERAIAKNIATCGRSVLSVINDVLDVSKLEAGKLTLVEAAFDPRHAVADAVAVVHAAADEKRLLHIVDVAPDVPAAIHCDPHRYQQVLLNLLGNAVKFTEQGSITVTVSASELVGGRLELLTTVADTGIGLSEAGQRLVFGRFEQAAFPSGQKPSGTGLGLAIARNITQLMGGRIWVESEPGRGSAFSFTVSAGKVAGGGAAAGRREGDGAATRPLRILVAEDEPVNQLVIGAFLEKAGHHFEFAATGRETVETYRAKGPFDLVLMDMHMPVMNGLEATRALRADPSVSPQPRIVALTAALLEEEQASYLSAGMDAVLAKPLEKPRLDALLSELASGLSEAPSTPAPDGALPQPSAAAAPPAARPTRRLRVVAAWVLIYYLSIVVARALARQPRLHHLLAAERGASRGAPADAEGRLAVAHRQRVPRQRPVQRAARRLHAPRGARDLRRQRARDLGRRRAARSARRQAPPQASRPEAPGTRPRRFRAVERLSADGTGLPEPSEVKALEADVLAYADAVASAVHKKIRDAV